jgi:nitrogen fixation NifU-like protein
MNEDLKSLYRDTLLEHSRHPRNQGALAQANASAELKNPLCGDVVSIHISTHSDIVDQARFEAQCCSICMASASMLTEAIAEEPIANAQRLARSLIDQLKNADQKLEFNPTLNSLSGVKSFPSRIRCATLPWEAMLDALEAISPE